LTKDENFYAEILVILEI